MPERINDPRTLEDWMVRMEQRIRELESRRLDAGTGLTQDHATKTMHAKMSDDPGNAAVVGSDGGIYAPDTVTTAADHTPLFCQQYMTANATINSGVDTLLIWSAVTSQGNWTTTTSTITIPETGKYMIVCSMQWQANANGARAIHMTVNSTAVTTGSAFANTTGNPGGSTSGAKEMAHDLVGVKDFTEGDVLRIYLFQDSGVALTAGGPYFGDIRGRWSVVKLFDADPPSLDQTTA